MLFTLLGLAALFLRDRNNDNNDHPGQDDIADRGDDLPPLENNDGQTSQEIPSDPVVLSTAEEPITGGDPHVEEDHSLEEPMTGEPQFDEDCSEYQSLEEPTVGDHQVDEDCSEHPSLVEPTVGDPQVNDWSQEQSIQEPIIGEPEGDDDYQSLDVHDDSSNYQSLDEFVSGDSQVDDDLSEDIYYSLPEYSLSSQLNQLQDKQGIIEINSYNYKIGDQLGEGGFGAVFEATRLEDDVQVAVKFTSKAYAEYVCVDDFNPTPLEVALQIVANQEPKIPQIVQLLDWKDEADCYIMVLERPMPSQSVDDFLRNYTGVIDEDLARVIMRQAVFAAQTCCQRGVFHRDIKPENLLINLDTLQVKLIDFGCGAFLNSEGYTYFSGTRSYCPPEYKIDGRYHGEPATVWSLGVLLFEMLCWDFPKCADLDLIKDKLWSKDELSPECCDFIGCCLRLDPKKRIKLDDVLLHDWFKHPMLNRQTSTPCWTGKPAPHAGPANQHPMLNQQQTSTPSPHAEPANQHPMLNQQTSTQCWTGKPAPHAEPANQHPMLNQQTSTPC
ncbi:hypothetical protein ABG768_023325 [Culter alburnus]|uniref:non-specific serine/threonine protein kinase n=1 Tax=Culter alburnus TaxID=194366 RepID=A0AAW2APB3_CULAL